MPRETNIDTVERALDKYVALMARRGTDPQGFRVSTLAKLIGETRGRMSVRLQQYRGSQARSNGQSTRYVLGAYSYGPDARWRILAKPGDDPAVVRKARRQQAKHIFKDAHSRIVSDLVHELYPGLSDTTTDRHIADLTDFARRQSEVLVDHIEAVLDRRRPASALAETHRSA
jgi:hypothetical protein